MNRKDLDSPRRELSNGGLESVVTLLVRQQINYSCASPGKAIQLYEVHCTPRLCRDKQRPIQCTLIVDAFGVKHEGKESLIGIVVWPYIYGHFDELEKICHSSVGQGHDLLSNDCKSNAH